MHCSKTLTAYQRLALNILIPSVYLIPIIVAFFTPKHFGFGSRWLTQTGLSIGLMGIMIWIMSMCHLGSSFAVLPGTKELITRGIYKYFLHPMYLGISLTLLGLTLACGSSFGIIYLAMVVLPVNLVRARLEEKALTDQFGKIYLIYKKNTWF